MLILTELVSSRLKRPWPGRISVTSGGDIGIRVDSVTVFILEWSRAHIVEPSRITSLVRHGKGSVHSIPRDPTPSMLRVQLLDCRPDLR